MMNIPDYAGDLQLLLASLESQPEARRIAVRLVGGMATYALASMHYYTTEGALSLALARRRDAFEAVVKITGLPDDRPMVEGDAS